MKGRKISNRTLLLQIQDIIKAAAQAYSKAQFDKIKDQLPVHNTVLITANKLSTMCAYRAYNKESLNAYRRDKY